MHSHLFYDSDNQEEWKEIELVNALRRGTEIEETQPGEPLQYNALKNRILDRVRYLANEMLRNNFLVEENLKIRMAKGFKDVWYNRQDYWEKKRLNNTFDSTASFSHEKLNLYDEDEDDCIPPILRKRPKSRPKNPIITQTKVTTTGNIPQRRKADALTALGNNSQGNSSSHPSKRAKVDTPQVAPLQNAVLPSTEIGHTGGVPMKATDISHSRMIDQETAEHIKFAENILGSPSMTVRAASPQPTTTTIRPSSRSLSITGDQPMAPASPIIILKPTLTINKPAQSISSASKTFNTSSTKTSFGTTKIMLPRETQKLEAAAPKLSTPKIVLSRSAASTISPSPAAISRRGGASEIFLTLQKRNKTWDLDHKFPASQYFKHLDLKAFFAFFSQRSRVPTAELDVLTFKLSFGNNPQQIEVMNKDSGEEEWERLKDKVRTFARFVKNENSRETSFDVWVEIGDGRVDVCDEEDDDEEDDFGGF